ncbi:MAG: sirohydrochlorin cobaltochelatase, partial [Anaerovorax sp.]
MSKQALVVVSFGTSHEKTRNETIGAIERALAKAFPQRVQKRAFTSGMIIKTLKTRDHLHIDNVTEAMESLWEEGFTDVLVQPTHIIN